MTFFETHQVSQIYSLASEGIGSSKNSQVKVNNRVEAVAAFFFFFWIQTLPKKDQSTPQGPVSFVCCGFLWTLRKMTSEQIVHRKLLSAKARTSEDTFWGCSRLFEEINPWILIYGHLTFRGYLQKSYMRTDLTSQFLFTHWFKNSVCVSWSPIFWDVMYRAHCIF